MLLLDPMCWHIIILASVLATFESLWFHSEVGFQHFKVSSWLSDKESGCNFHFSIVKMLSVGLCI